ncbi:MAG: hypothetical protein R3D45_16525 [Rhizobiaceae bacterium]
MAAPMILLAACQSEPLGGPLSIEVAATSPITALQAVNDAGRRCWTGSGDHRFRAYRLVPELDTTAGNPRILVTEKGREAGRPQLVIESSGNPVKIETYGPLAHSRLGSRINADIMRWSSGDKRCAGHG